MLILVTIACSVLLVASGSEAASGCHGTENGYVTGQSIGAHAGYDSATVKGAGLSVGSPVALPVIVIVIELVVVVIGLGIRRWRVARRPVVLRLKTARAPQGETLNVTIAGRNLARAKAVSFEDGITVNTLTVYSPTQVTANVTINKHARVGMRDVSIAGRWRRLWGTGTMRGAFAVERAEVREPSPPVTTEASAITGLGGVPGAWSAVDARVQMLCSEGDLEAALAILKQQEHIRRVLDPGTLASCLTNEALVLIAMGREREAWPLAQEACRMSTDDGPRDILDFLRSKVPKTLRQVPVLRSSALMRI